MKFKESVEKATGGKVQVQIFLEASWDLRREDSRTYRKALFRQPPWR
jgi:hypothetical protein